ncbi:hypothetical protein [Coleofasciculus sp. F4-SAH-05]|uniref:hypothetical protein n=1 Tax=Coleofasciculus sp. F4-SAH-05 TaxID=3069525 RepID=UPI0032FCA808
MVIFLTLLLYSKIFPNRSNIHLCLPQIKNKNALLGVVLVILWISNSNLASADISKIYFTSSAFQVQQISSLREVREPINLEQFGLEYWYRLTEDIPTANQLIKLSKRLRDAARYLGSTWPVILPIISPLNGEMQQTNGNYPHLTITDIREPGGNWVSMTAGQTLKLVTQELEILKKSGDQPLVDFLVKDEVSGKYHPLTGVPLNRYCYELLKNLKL